MGEAALKREFQKQPPREPLDTMGALWRDYMWRYVNAGRQDPCVYWTKDADDIHEAIRRACASTGANGKMFFHQSKVRKVNRIALCKKLWADDRLQGIGFMDFAELYDIVREHGEDTPGIGDVTIYDVASRLGAWAEFEPEHLYFHAGVLMGLKSLGVKPPNGAFRISPDHLPKFFLDKNLDLVESFLCGYRSEIERIVNSKKEA